jgi:hypothetical protein
MATVMHKFHVVLRFGAFDYESERRAPTPRGAIANAVRRSMGDGGREALGPGRHKPRYALVWKGDSLKFRLFRPKGDKWTEEKLKWPDMRGMRRRAP